MSKKYSIIGLATILLIGTWVVVRFVFGGPEDDWICQNGQWVKHGNPTASMPATGCGENTNATMPNPASVYCEEQGGTLEIVTANDGSQSGLCKFSDGRECAEWDFFRKK